MNCSVSNLDCAFSESEKACLLEAAKAAALNTSEIKRDEIDAALRRLIDWIFKCKLPIGSIGDEYAANYGHVFRAAVIVEKYVLEDRTSNLSQEGWRKNAG